MVAMGKQLVIILDNENVRKTGNLSAEEQEKLKILEDAQAQKQVLEDILYHTFITISEGFKTQIEELAKVNEATKAWQWEEIEEIQKFYNFLAEIYNNENGIPRVILMYSIMMCAHKVGVTWIDEVSEALKNCAVGLDSYINICQGIPVEK